ncbi:MAG: lipoyl synthase [Microthrixaceae bacterium]
MAPDPGAIRDPDHVVADATTRRDALHIRWLGRVDYRDALGLQHALFDHGTDDHLLLLEHPHTYTMGVRADAANVLVDPAEVGADLVRADRGGDVTYHGPGQLVGYPILTLADHDAGEMASTRAHVTAIEELLIAVLDRFGIGGAKVVEGCPGVWLGADGPRPRKIAAVGVRLSRGRTMHGFALNVDTDATMFDHIVACGLSDKGVTSMRAEGCAATMRDVVEAVGERAGAFLGRPDRLPRSVDRAAATWRSTADDRDLTAFSRGEGPGAVVRYTTRRPEAGGTGVRLLGRLADAGVDTSAAVPITDAKPAHMRAPLRLGGEVLALRRTVRDLGLVTVCEEAGCPNLSECWSDGTATFMLCGERCTRACGFCLVDTSKPLPLDPTEPDRVAAAVERTGLRFAVLTMVARDDLDDGGAAHVAATVRAIHERVRGASVEVLVSDLRGEDRSLRTVFDSRPEVFNHNIETVLRLQRAVRPSASYARSLSVLGRARRAGLVTKSSLVVGMGERDDEILQTLGDLAEVGVRIVTIGQYLRPTTHHLPVERWWEPADFERWKHLGERMGIDHVESSPLTRSSYHARTAADTAAAAAAPRADRPAVRVGGPRTIDQPPPSGSAN